MELKIKMDTSKLDRRLKVIANGTKDLRRPLTETGDKLLDFYQKDVFDSQGTKMKGKWSPLQIRTLKMRADKHGHYKNSPTVKNMMLVWTGKMRKGFKKVVKRTKLTISNTVSYFGYNQKKRPMLGINKRVRDIVEKTFKKYINDLLKK